MGVVISELCIDCVEPVSLARWWAEVLGWTHVEIEDDGAVWVAESPEETRGLLFAAVPERKVVKNRVHLDVRPRDGSDQETELRRLLELGATPVDVGQGDDVSWHVLADPEGNEFCLLRRTPSETAAEAG